MPEQKRAKALHWKPLLNSLEDSPIVKVIDKTELRIVFRSFRYADGIVRQPPDIVLAGADRDADKVRGFRLWGCLLDEYQDFPATAWRLSIRPALADTPGSWAYFIFTPKGKASVAAKLKRQMRGKPGWCICHAKTADNPFIDPKEIEKAKAELPPRDFRQEWEASEEDFPGKIYSSFERDRHLVDSYPEDYTDCWMGLDCGDVNPAVVVDVRKRLGNKDYWWRVHAEQMGNGKDAIADSEQDKKILAIARQWPRLQGILMSPERTARAQDIKIVGEENNFPPLMNVIGANNSIYEGNSHVNALYHQNRLFILRDCSKQPNDVDMADEAGSYHRATDRSGTFLDKPADGQQDHRCEAGRYLHFTLKMRPHLLEPTSFVAPESF